jgi:hypothetical protein
MRKLSKKTLAVATAVVLLSGGGAAFAYWTAGGAGTGTATSGTTVAVTVHQTAMTGLYPGQAAQTLSGTFDNPNAGPVYVTAVTATGYTIDAAHVTAGCAVSGNYTLSGTAAVGHNVITGNGVDSWTGLAITMNNLGTNQDPCKGAIVTITYASS